MHADHHRRHLARDPVADRMTGSHHQHMTAQPAAQCAGGGVTEPAGGAQRVAAADPADVAERGSDKPLECRLTADAEFAERDSRFAGQRRGQQRRDAGDRVEAMLRLRRDVGVV